MRSDWKDKWVKALRSGRYKQTQGTLQDSVGNCCLGVLCRVVRAKRDATAIDRFGWGDDWDFHNLPSSLRKAAGISPKMEGRLVKLNDGDHCGRTSNFKQIADFIEKRL